MAPMYRFAAFTALIGMAGAHTLADVTCAIVQFSEQTRHAVAPDDDRFENYVREAAGHGAELVVGPENCFYRYTPEMQEGVSIRELAEAFDATVAEFKALAQELGVCIVFGTREPAGDAKTYQSGVYIDNRGQVVKVYRKRVPSNSEKSFTEAGGGWDSFTTPFGECFMQVCKDMDGDGYIGHMPTDIDYFIGINKDPDRGWVKVDAGCRKAECCGIGVNWAGGTYDGSDQVDGGNSGFVDPEGNVLSEAGPGTKIVYATLPLDRQVTRVIPAVAPHGDCSTETTAYNPVMVFSIAGRLLAPTTRRQERGVIVLVKHLNETTAGSMHSTLQQREFGASATP